MLLLFLCCASWKRLYPMQQVFRCNLVESYPWPFDFRAIDDIEQLVPYSQQTLLNFPQGFALYHDEPVTKFLSSPWIQGNDTHWYVCLINCRTSSLHSYLIPTTELQARSMSFMHLLLQPHSPCNRNRADPLFMSCTPMSFSRLTTTHFTLVNLEIFWSTRLKDQQLIHFLVSVGISY